MEVAIYKWLIMIFERVIKLTRNTQIVPCHSGKVWVSLAVVEPPLEGIFHVLNSKREIGIDFTPFRNLVADGDVAKATIIASLFAYVL